MKYIPRPNWSITWSGLEKISFLKNIAQRVQLKHSYTSKYSEGWKIDPDGNKQIQTQKISYGFAPLIGISLTFPKMWDGNLTGSIQYNTTSNYDLGTTTRNITEGFSKDISFTASYSKSGFELPLFGVSLKNDIEVSLSYTTSENSSVIYEMDDFVEDGTPQDGTTRTSIEPRVKYVMSSRVTLSLFYKRTTVEPKGAARIPPTTTNEAGLEVHISIQ
jgi:cell surface protein SprA